MQIVLGDKNEQKSFNYTGSTCFNPGSFSNDDPFIAYRSCTHEVELLGLWVYHLSNLFGPAMQSGAKCNMLPFIIALWPNYQEKKSSNLWKIKGNCLLQVSWLTVALWQNKEEVILLTYDWLYTSVISRLECLSAEQNLIIISNRDWCL